MIDINLLPGKKDKRKIDYAKIFRSYKSTLIYFAWGAGVFIMVFSLLVIVYPRVQARTLGKLEKRWSRIEPEYKEAARLDKEYQQALKQSEDIKSIEGTRILWAKAMNIVSDNLPPEIQLTRMTTSVEKTKEGEDKKVLTITGVVPAYPGDEAVSAFIGGLSANSDFTDKFPRISHPSTRTLPDGMKEFTLKCYKKNLTPASSARDPGGKVKETVSRRGARKKQNEK